jgi:hypothetical protein
MSSCDSSLLNNISDEITKLSGSIVRRWWSTQGLPYVMDIFLVVSGVRVFVACCNVWVLSILNFVRCAMM